MSELAIKVENVSKLYRLGDVGTGTLGEDITRFWAKVRGKEDPFSQVAAANDRSKKANSDYVWSLRDIDFEIKKGDAVGIIGRNGAGKSTLLKILSRITSPTTGSIKINGRVASLLEVGTGFNPDLTGRQNIYMNGAILGMTRAEVKSKMDEMIDFSGVEGYIDTPVKRYSSGMYVRLAFSVAAHLDPEIMIVDEVLAVGDSEFQKKCLGKMQDVNNKDGRTILFVSHNISAIYSLTNTCIFLKNGQVVKTGTTEEVVKEYQDSDAISAGRLLSFTKKELNPNKPIELLHAEIKYLSDSGVTCNIRYIVRENVGSVVSIKITNDKGTVILTLRDTDTNPDIFNKKPGNYQTTFLVPTTDWAVNLYRVTISFSDMKSERFDYFEDLLSFETEIKSDVVYSAPREGVLFPEINWNTVSI